MDQVIGLSDLFGYAVTYLFALLGMFALLVQMMTTLRERRLSLAYRTIAMSLGMLVLLLVVPALAQNLSERANVVLAGASALLGLLAAREALMVPRTRALGAMLASASAAALLHVSAVMVAWYAGNQARYRLAVSARGMATASVIFDTLAMLVALAWLATRNKGRTGWATRGALLVACVVAWGAGRGAIDGAPIWEVVARRGIDRLLGPPAPYLWQPYLYLLEAMAPFLALVAVGVRRQIPAVTASFALILIARPSTDVPLSALAFVLAALAAPLAAHDDRGMWAVLLTETSSLPVASRRESGRNAPRPRGRRPNAARRTRRETFPVGPNSP